jgi:hypothetical protein
MATSSGARFGRQWWRPSAAVARQEKGTRRERREEGKVVLWPIWAEGRLRQGMSELHGGNHGGRARDDKREQEGGN